MYTILCCPLGMFVEGNLLKGGSTGLPGESSRLKGKVALILHGGVRQGCALCLGAESESDGKVGWRPHAHSYTKNHHLDLERRERGGSFPVGSFY